MQGHKPHLQGADGVQQPKLRLSAAVACWEDRGCHIECAADGAMDHEGLAGCDKHLQRVTTENSVTLEDREKTALSAQALRPGLQ